MLIELSNVLWKKRRLKELPDDEVYWIIDEIFNHLGVRLVESYFLLAHAIQTAMDVDRSVYDALYLAAAELYDGVLMTADEKLVNSLRRHPIARRITFLGSL